MTAAMEMSVPGGGAAGQGPDSAGSRFTIQDLAKAFGLTARTLRHYEEKGLISPAREGQARIYGVRDRARLSLVLRGKRLGFSLEEIKELLDLYDLRDGQVTQLTATRDTFDGRIAQLEAQRQDIDAALAELRSGRAAIETMLKARQAKTGSRQR